MKSLMLKLLILIVSSSFLLANEKELIEFLKHGGNSKFVIKEVKIEKKIPIINAKGWSAYLLNYKFKSRDNNKTKEEQNVIYSNGELVAFDMFNLSTKKNLIELFIGKKDIKSKPFSDKELLSFLKQNRNDKIVVNDIKIVGKKRVREDNNWIAYYFLNKIKIKDSNKTIIEPSMLFSNSILISTQLFNIKKRRGVERTLSPDFDPKLYNKKHLLYGEENAPNKIVLFSDPQCPFCLDRVPFIFDLVKKNPKKVALYYYHFPLNIHPASKTIVKATMVAKKRGVKDIIYKVYDAYLDIESRDKEKILKLFNEKLKTNITIDDIKKPDVLKEYNEDIEMAKRMFVGGTPTLYINGEYDYDGSRYRKLEKELKK